MHPPIRPRHPKPVTHVTPHHQTSPTTPKNYGFPKTDAPVARVTMPYQFLLPSKGKRGCRTPLRGPSAHNFFIYCANPFLLFRLKTPASHSPALGPSAPLPMPRPAGGGVEQPGRCRQAP
nr:MAG TPA: hypothetical protein [Caudoviricetes sp.]